MLQISCSELQANGDQNQVEGQREDYPVVFSSHETLKPGDYIPLFRRNFCRGFAGFMKHITPLSGFVLQLLPMRLHLIICFNCLSEYICGYLELLVFLLKRFIDHIDEDFLIQLPFRSRRDAMPRQCIFLSVEQIIQLV